MDTGRPRPQVNRYDRTKIRSRAELPQVMIQVFVHSATPVLWSECAEKGMRVPSTLRFPALVKLPHFSLVLLPLARKVALIRDYELWIRGTALREWLLVRIDRSEEQPEHSPDEYAWRVEPAGRHVERRGAVRHHLRHVHFSPLALRGWLQRVDPGDDFGGCVFLK